MRSDFRLTHRKGRPYQVMFAYNEGKWYSTGTHNKTQALIWATQHLGIGLDSKVKQNITVEEFAKPFLDSAFKDMRERDIARGYIIGKEKYTNMVALIKKYILPFHSTLKVREITPALIEDMLIKQDISAVLKNTTLHAYKRLLEEAVRMDVVDRNSAELVKPFIYKQELRQAFTKEEYKRLFPQNRIELLRTWETLEWAGYFLVLRDTGFRPSECAGLTPFNITEDGGVFTTHSINSDGEWVERIKTTDSGQDYKIGLLSKQALEIIKELEEKAKDNEHNLLFVAEDQRKRDIRMLPITPHKANRQLQRAFKYCELDINGRTQYSFRHTFNTNIYSKVNEDVRLELMGHTSNIKAYDHRTPLDRLNALKQKERVVDVIENLND